MRSSMPAAAAAGSTDTTDTDDIEVSESPEVYHGGINGSQVQLPSSPILGTHAQPIHTQQHSPSANRGRSLARRDGSSHRPQQRSGPAEAGAAGAAAEDLPAAPGATSSAGASTDNNSSNYYSGSEESADECSDESNEDTDWTPKHIKQQQQRGRHSAGSARKAKAQANRIRTPVRQPFPEIQHAAGELRHLSSPTRNRTIQECLAAMAAASPAKQPQAASLPGQSPAAADHSMLAAAAAAAEQGASSFMLQQNQQMADVEQDWQPLAPQTVAAAQRAVDAGAAAQQEEQQMADAQLPAAAVPELDVIELLDSDSDSGIEADPAECDQDGDVYSEHQSDIQYLCEVPAPQQPEGSQEEQQQQQHQQVEGQGLWEWQLDNEAEQQQDGHVDQQQQQPGEQAEPSTKRHSNQANEQQTDEEQQQQRSELWKEACDLVKLHFEHDPHSIYMLQSCLDQEFPHCQDLAAELAFPGAVEEDDQQAIQEIIQDGLGLHKEPRHELLPDLLRAIQIVSNKQDQLNGSMEQWPFAISSKQQQQPGRRKKSRVGSASRRAQKAAASADDDKQLQSTAAPEGSQREQEEQQQQQHQQDEEQGLWEWQHDDEGEQQQQDDVEQQQQEEDTDLQSPEPQEHFMQQQEEAEQQQLSQHLRPQQPEESEMEQESSEQQQPQQPEVAHTQLLQQLQQQQLPQHGGFSQGEALQQQQRQPQADWDLQLSHDASQQQQPWLHVSSSQHLGGQDAGLVSKRNLSVSSIREEAAAAKAARIAAKKTGALQRHCRNVLAADVVLEARDQLASYLHSTAAAASAVPSNIKSGCNPARAGAAKSGVEQQHAPTLSGGSTPTHSSQQLTALERSTAQLRRRIARHKEQVIDSAMRQHPDPSIRAIAGGFADSSRKQSRRDSWGPRQLAFDAAAATDGTLVAAAAEAAAAADRLRASRFARAAAGTGLMGRPQEQAAAGSGLAAGVTAPTHVIGSSAGLATAPLSRAPAAAAVETVVAVPKPRVSIRKRGRQQLLQDSHGAAAADSNGSGQAAAAGAKKRHKPSPAADSGAESVPAPATAAAMAAAAGPDAPGPDDVDRRLVLDHLTLLPKDHLRAWPAVPAGCKDILPKYPCTPAARNVLDSTVNNRSRKQGRTRTAGRQAKHGARKAARLAAVSSPCSLKPGDGEYEYIEPPLPEALDSEYGVFKAWSQVPKGWVVWAEQMADGLVFHPFKQKYGAIFGDAQRRDQLNDNILVAQADGCHPCNHNPLEPLRSQEEQLQLAEQYYQAQLQLLQQPGGPTKVQEQQLQRQLEQQHSLGRVLLAARDLAAYELLGMYTPSEDGLLTTNEDDDRGDQDFTCAYDINPYKLSFDSLSSESDEHDCVMIRADPTKSIMALLNDCTDWTVQMEQLGKVCPSRAQKNPAACTCYKYKSRSSNVVLVPSLYKAYDGKAVPVALFFTTRAVLALEELLWSYAAGDSDQLSPYFAQQKTQRLRHAYGQLEKVHSQMASQWAAENIRHHSQEVAKFKASEHYECAAPTAMQWIRVRQRHLLAQVATEDYLHSKMARLRCLHLAEQLLGPAPMCGTLAASAGAAGASYSSGQPRAKTRAERQEQEQAATLVRQLRERRALEADPVTALENALAIRQLAGQHLVAYQLKDIDQTLQQLKAKQEEVHSTRQEGQLVFERLQQLQQPAVSRQAAAQQSSIDDQQPQAVVSQQLAAGSATHAAEDQDMDDLGDVDATAGSC